MKKICCIEDANITPKNSSCSMVLRSACSSGHSHKALVVSKDNNQGVTHQKRKLFKRFTGENQLDTSEDSGQFDSYIHSSLKHLAYKSAKTYSFLKESLCNHLEITGTQNHKLLNGNEGITEFNKELCSDQISTSHHPFLNNNSVNAEECSYINNNCITTSYSKIMSRARDFSRRSISTANALSESENEDSLSQNEVRKRRSNRGLISKLKSSVGRTESLVSNNSNHTSTKNSTSVYKTAHTSIETEILPPRTLFSVSNANYQTPSSANAIRSDLYLSGSDASCESPCSPSVIDISTVQYSAVDRIRWFLWRSIYLKIIKCVNFDVWLLSRLHKYRKRIVLLILLPLLLYLLYGALLKDSRSTSLDDLSSSTIAFSSYIYSIVSSPFLYNQELISESSSEEQTCSRKFSEILYAILLAISNFFSNFFVRISETVSVISKPAPTAFQTTSPPDKEELKSIAMEVLEEKLSFIVETIQATHSEHHTVQPVKDDGLSKIKEEIASLHFEFQSLRESVQKLGKDVAQKAEAPSLKLGNVVEEHGAHITSINLKMKDFEEKLLTLSGTIKNCCDDRWTMSDFAASFEKHFIAALKNVVDEDENSPYHFFNKWIYTKTVGGKAKLSEELKFEFEKLMKDQEKTNMKYDETSQKVVEKVVQRYMESLQRNLTTSSKTNVNYEGSYSLDLVRKLVKDAIMLYDADKTGLVDYALESGGGSVLSTRCSENYAEKDGTISILGFPLWSTHNSPRTAIQPDMQPGQCWAFKGSQGFLVVQLAYIIFPTGFTVEHIPVSLSPSGSIDSAPKEFSVWGLVSEKDNDGKILGTYTYDQEGDPLQYFAVQNTYDEPFSLMELKIHSNHGNLDYTCLYRFRVHGNQTKR